VGLLWVGVRHRAPMIPDLIRWRSGPAP
jgi:hypothetical protein